MHVLNPQAEFWKAKIASTLAEFPFMRCFVSPSCLHGYFSNHLIPFTISPFYYLSQCLDSLSPKESSNVGGKKAHAHIASFLTWNTEQGPKKWYADGFLLDKTIKERLSGTYINCDLRPEFSFRTPSSGAVCVKLGSHAKTYPAGWAGAACWPRASFYGRPCD